MGSARNLGVLVGLSLFLLLYPDLVFAAKKDYKGLFGNYRRERFVENEANDTDFGVDLMLSTLIPITTIASSTENRSNAPTPMSQATFFNVEASFFFSLSYHFEIFTNIGYYNYDTRRQNSTGSTSNPAQPLFHQFELEAYPAMVGVKYRLGTEDIVPYIGVGAGLAYVRRKGFYDYTTLALQEYLTAAVGQVVVGLEFFLSSRAGIRLETAAHYFNLPSRTFDDVASNPVMTFNSNPWSIRYASGVFFLF